jgi:Tfp pilus assembly protein PilN
MRLEINLASQPYEDARQFWTRWGTAVGAVGVLTLFLVTMTVTGWIHARRDHQEMTERRAAIADRDRVRAEAEAFLSRPENRTTRDTSQFLNELIERKAFSWTQVLESLERVMPPRVHLVGINPELDEDNQVSLKMAVAGDSRDRALELARHMEESHRFGQTTIVSEHSFPQATNGDTEAFDIVAQYIPDLSPVTDAPGAAKGETKSDAKPGENKAETKSGTTKPVTAQSGTTKPVTTTSPKPPVQVAPQKNNPNAANPANPQTRNH